MKIGTILCDCLCSENFMREELRKLFCANIYQTYRYQTYVSKEEGRGKWLWELITKYNAFYKGYSKNIVMSIGVSHEHPIILDDINYANEINFWLYDQIKGEAEINWWPYYNDSLGDQLRLSVLCYE